MTGRRKLIAMAAATVLLAACGGNGDENDGAADGGDREAGREIFVSVADPPCGSCHTLADADATGAAAPSLDELRPSADRVAQAVRSGPGIMPSYEGQLSEDQIDELAAYVEQAEGKE